MIENEHDLFPKVENEHDLFPKAVHLGVHNVWKMLFVRCYTLIQQLGVFQLSFCASMKLPTLRFKPTYIRSQDVDDFRYYVKAWRLGILPFPVEPPAR